MQFEKTPIDIAIYNGRADLVDLLHRSLVSEIDNSTNIYFTSNIQYRIWTSCEMNS